MKKNLLFNIVVYDDNTMDVESITDFTDAEIVNFLGYAYYSYVINHFKDQDCYEVLRKIIKDPLIGMLKEGYDA